jgi:hypothetical protein
MGRLRSSRPAAFMMAWAFKAARRQFAKTLTRPVAIQRQRELNR